jgi:hypothetical protein
MLCRVNRLWRVILLVLLLGPAIGPSFLPAEDLCGEQRDCCDQDRACDVTCVRCACCASRPISPTPAEMADALDAPPASTVILATAFPPPAPTSDILHVPKSV